MCYINAKYYCYNAVCMDTVFGVLCLLAIHSLSWGSHHCQVKEYIYLKQNYHMIAWVATILMIRIHHLPALKLHLKDEKPQALFLKKYTATLFCFI